MKKKLNFTTIIVLLGFTVNAQCHYIPSTSTSTDTLSYNFSGGTFGSYGCAPIDPTYWLSGNGNSVTVTFVKQESYPSFRVWGMNTDDTASLTVNNYSYPLTSSSASYDAKVVCGLSPGPDGVLFAKGKLVGANTNDQGNYSYQNILLNTTDVTTFKITGISGKGWGFAGVSVGCPTNGISQLYANKQQVSIYPNPFYSVTKIQFNSTLVNAELHIYNIYGQEVKQLFNLFGKIIIFNRDNLPSGVYFILLTEENRSIATEKLIILEN